MFAQYVEIFPTKRDSGYLKTIHFKVPISFNGEENVHEISLWDIDSTIGKDGNIDPMVHVPDEDELADEELLAAREAFSVLKKVTMRALYS